jgi:hypothetical protein
LECKQTEKAWCDRWVKGCRKSNEYRNGNRRIDSDHADPVAQHHPCKGKQSSTDSKQTQYAARRITYRSKRLNCLQAITYTHARNAVDRYAYEHAGTDRNHPECPQHLLCTSDEER